MKGIIRSFTIHAFALWIIAGNIGGLHYGNDPRYLLLGALALTLIDVLLKPLINLLLLPLNLVTLGTLRWISSALTLYLATLIVPSFQVVAFKFPGFTSSLFIIPAINFSTFGAYILISILISLVVSFFYWLSR